MCACITDNELPSKLRVYNRIPHHPHTPPTANHPCCCVSQWSVHCWLARYRIFSHFHLRFSHTHYFTLNTKSYFSFLCYENWASVFLVSGILQDCTVHVHVFVAGYTANTLCSNVFSCFHRCYIYYISSLLSVVALPTWMFITAEDYLNWTSYDRPWLRKNILLSWLHISTN